MAREDRPLPAVFVQYGVYHNSKKREDTKFTVLYHIKPEELEREIKKCINSLNQRALKRAQQD